AAKLAIVRDVGLGHEQVVVPDARDSSSSCRPAMYGDKLANMVPLADLNRRRFTGVLKVLRGESDRGKREDVSVGADTCFAIDDSMRLKANAVGQLNLIAHSTKGTDMTIFADLRRGAKDGGRMNKC